MVLHVLLAFPLLQVLGERTIYEQKIDTLKTLYANSTRYIYIGGWRHSVSDGAPEKQMIANSSWMSDQQYFVKRAGTGLKVNGKPFVIVGSTNQYVVTRAVHQTTRQQALDVFKTSKALGFNTLRIWAFGDGEGPHNKWYPIQKDPNIIDDQVLREGLDWVVAEARKYGLRLILVLTNAGSYENGGAYQYCQWVEPSLTLHDFWTNDTVKATYLDFMSSIVTRLNPLTGLEYRDDPTILGWELADRAAHPGVPGSRDLHAWIHQFAGFVKRWDQNHLVMVGSVGYFGPQSPHLLKHNPPRQIFQPATSVPHFYDAVCEGTDFHRNHLLLEVDMAEVQLFPDEWLACSEECKRSWSRAWIRAHLKEAIRFGKPLLISAVGKQRPPYARTQFFEMLKEELQLSLKKDYPLAGVLVHTLSSSHHPDYDSYAIYNDRQGMMMARPDIPDPSVQMLEDQEWARFTNWPKKLTCLQVKALGAKSQNGEYTGWVDGWNQTLTSLGKLSEVVHVHNSKQAGPT